MQAFVIKMFILVVIIDNQNIFIMSAVKYTISNNN